MSLNKPRIKELMNQQTLSAQQNFQGQYAVLKHVRYRFDHSTVIEGAAEPVIRLPHLEQISTVVDNSLPHAALQELITALSELKSQQQFK